MTPRSQRTFNPVCLAAGAVQRSRSGLSPPVNAMGMAICHPNRQSQNTRIDQQANKRKTDLKRIFFTQRTEAEINTPEDKQA